MASRKEPPMPKQILDYNIIKELGRGSFGLVFLAKDSCKETVAIKCIEWRETYTQREMEIAWKLEPHANIVAVLELFQYDYKGQQFHCIVMEYCEGGNLNTHIIDTKPSIEDVLQYMVDLVKGLAHLHKNELIHRDLKAENVLLSHNGRRWSCKIGDFSIAKFQVGNRVTMTYFGHFYEAPEVVERPTYTFSADIYSLGLLFFVMYVQETVVEDGIKLLAPCMRDKRGRERGITECVRAGLLDESTFNRKYFKKMPQMGALVSQMLEYDPCDRPTLKRIHSEVEEICSSQRQESSRGDRGFRRRPDGGHSDMVDREERKERLDRPRRARGQVVNDDKDGVVRPQPRSGHRKEPQPSEGIANRHIKDTFQLLGKPSPQRFNEFDDDDDDDIVIPQPSKSKVKQEERDRVVKRREEQPRERKHKERQEPDGRERRHIISEQQREQRKLRKPMEDLHLDSDRRQRNPGSPSQRLEERDKKAHQIMPPPGFHNIKDTFQLQKEKCHLFPRMKRYDDDDDDNDF